MTDVDPVLLVDLGGVLFEFDHDHRLEVLADLFGLTAARVHDLLWASGFSADCDAGRYADAAAVRAEVKRLTGYAGEDPDLDEAWCSAFRPDPAVVELVSRTMTSCGIFTNNGPLEEDALMRLYPAAFRPFDHLFFCHRLDANKPDRAVYRQVTDLLDVPAAAIRFVDDSEDNVRAATDGGWQAVKYRALPDLVGLIP